MVTIRFVIIVVSLPSKVVTYFVKWQYSYSGGKVQLRFLKLLSYQGHQQFSYRCCDHSRNETQETTSQLSNPIPIPTEDNSLQAQILGYSGTEVGDLGQYLQRREFQSSSCSVSCSKFN